MDVTDVLRSRMQEPPGLQRMAAISALIHAALVALILVGPASWISRHADNARPVMTITLSSGAPGQQTGGFTALGGRAVQVETPPSVKRPEPVTPAAPKAPEMTVPGKAPLKATPASNVKQAPDGARGRTPSKGAETAAGSTAVDTNVRGQGFGLSTSSGGLGKGWHLDVTDFCCPSYLETMNTRIRQNWNFRAEVPSSVEIKFTINRDGTLTPGTVQRSSGSTELDVRAQRAIAITRQIPPLPAEFPNPTLTVYLTFEYTR
jgi:TonB family protein